MNILTILPPEGNPCVVEAIVLSLVELSALKVKVGIFPNSFVRVMSDAKLSRVQSLTFNVIYHAFFKILGGCSFWVASLMLKFVTFEFILKPHEYEKIRKLRILRLFKHFWYFTRIFEKYLETILSSFHGKMSMAPNSLIQPSGTWMSRSRSWSPLHQLRLSLAEEPHGSD